MLYATMSSKLHISKNIGDRFGIAGELPHKVDEVSNSLIEHTITCFDGSVADDFASVSTGSVFSSSSSAGATALSTVDYIEQ